MSEEKKTAEVYPALNRIFINGEWIGSPNFANYINTNETVIELSYILHMNDVFDVIVNTPASTLYYGARVLRLNTEKSSVEIMVDSTNLLNPAIAGLFTFTNSLILINKENAGAAMCIELIQLPAEFVDPNHQKDVQFPFWFASTSCIFGKMYERTLMLLNKCHEPMSIDIRAYSPETVEMCESNSKYLNIFHKDMRSDVGIVPGKLVLFDNKIYTIKGFDKQIIDGTVTETRAIILVEINFETANDETKMPLYEFIENCKWISPFAPVITSNELSKKITIVTPSMVMNWYSKKSGSKIARVYNDDRLEFFDAFDIITSHLNDDNVEDIGIRLDSILRIYESKSLPDLTVFVIPAEYGGGIIINNDVAHNDKLGDYSDYCDFDDEDEGDIDE